MRSLQKVKEGGWVVHRYHSQLYSGEPPEVKYTSFRVPTTIFTAATGYRVLLVRVARGIMGSRPTHGTDSAPRKYVDIKVSQPERREITPQHVPLGWRGQTLHITLAKSVRRTELVYLWLGLKWNEGLGLRALGFREKTKHGVRSRRGFFSSSV